MKLKARRSALALAALVTSLAAACISPLDAESGPTGQTRLPETEAARSRIRDLSRRFADLVARPVEASPLTAAARVELPVRASGYTRVHDDRSGVGVRFALMGAADVRGAEGEGVALYEGALHGADVLERLSASGTEDYVVFERAPSVEAVSYAVELERVAGLRFIGNSLELLDVDGTPRLRVAPPYLVDEQGHRTEATLSLVGCAADTDPRPPWGRAVTPPGAARCEVRVTWSGVSYPAVLDPSWTTTASMSIGRALHTATLLPSGKVLVVGGPYISSAELFDPVTKTFAGTGGMSTNRASHSATLLPSGKVLVIGGIVNAGTVASSAELYDPTTGTFSKFTSTMPGPRSGHTATLLDTGKVLIVGADDFGNALLFDPVAGTFAATGTLAAPRYGLAAAKLANGKVLVCGGGNVIVYAYKTCELYDPSTGTFGSAPTMTVYRKSFTMTTLSSGKVLAAGTSGTSMPAELFDPVNNTWTALPSTLYPQASQSATVLNDGTVLLVNNTDAERFDPSTGTFLAAGTMTMSRGGSHTATLLPSGSVLVTGGDYFIGISQTARDSAELYGDGNTPVDAGAVDSGAGAVDAGAVDAGAVDAGAFDAGSGAFDAGSSPDSGTKYDAGAVDASAVDASAANDAGKDAGKTVAPADAATGSDSGNEEIAATDSGCSCRTTRQGGDARGGMRTLIGAIMGLALLVRRFHRARAS